MATDDQHAVPPGALARFAAERASEAEQRLIARHLLARCPVCTAGLRARGWSLGHARQRAPGAYDAVFARCLRRTMEEAERRRGRAVVARLLAALDAIPAQERELKARNVSRFASLDLSAALVERSHAARFKDPEALLRDARLAAATAEAAAARRAAEEEVLHDACARAWVQVRIYAGDPESAIEPLLLAMGLTESCGDEDLHRAAAHNLIWSFRDLGRPRQAEQLALRAERHFERSRDPLVLLRVDWQRGLIDRDLGRLDIAARRLSVVRDGFAERDLCYEVGVVSLDLVSVYLLDGQPIDALKLLGEVVPLFHSLGIARELLAALAQLAACVRQRDTALGLLRAISKQLAPGIPRDPA